MCPAMAWRGGGRTHTPRTAHGESSGKLICLHRWNICNSAMLDSTWSQLLILVAFRVDLILMEKPEQRDTYPIWYTTWGCQMKERSKRLQKYHRMKHIERQESQNRIPLVNEEASSIPQPQSRFKVQKHYVCTVPYAICDLFPGRSKGNRCTGGYLWTGQSPAEFWILESMLSTEKTWAILIGARTEWCLHSYSNRLKRTKHLLTCKYTPRSITW